MSQENKKTVVLAIFAHSDDELGVAGTLANHSDKGDEVHLAFLTKGENASTVKGTPEEIEIKRKEHTRKISELLGVTVHYLDFPDSHIEYNVESGYKVAELLKKIRPNILITWSKLKNLGGGHPDHRNTADLVWDAISYARYKNPNSKYKPYRDAYSFYTYVDYRANPNAQLTFVDVTEQESRIHDFIAIYKEAYGDWPVEEFKFNSLTFYGRMARVKYAEAFEVILTSKPAGKLLE